jgi:hypothetical protein
VARKPESRLGEIKPIVARHPDLTLAAILQFLFPLFICHFQLSLVGVLLLIVLRKMEARVDETVATLAPQLEEICLKIHSNPELLFKEYKATQWYV